MPLGLVALTLGAFGIGLTEFVILGLLPDVAADLGVTETSAGYLVSGYALAVAVGGVALTAAVLRFDRKSVLVSLMGLFVAGNLLSALAPGYEALLAGRVLAALCHGAFFGIGAVVAADMVAPDKRARAVATMFTGLTVANVLGVPLGTFLGQEHGWRSTFWAITVIGVVALLGVLALVPSTRSSDAPVPSLRTELGAFRSGQVWWSMLITVLGFGGMFGAFTYLAFTFTDIGGFSTGAVPWLLVLVGAGLVVGNWLGGRAADQNLTRSLAVILTGLTLALAALALGASSQVATVVLLPFVGAFGFATVPGLQTRIMQRAAAAPTLASGANIAAFNVGNAFGAWLGGLTIGAGLGYTSPLWAGALMTLAALGTLGVASTKERRSTSRTASVAPSRVDATTPTTQEIA